MPTAGNWIEMALTRNDAAVFGADATALDGSQLRFPSGRLKNTYRDGKFKQIGGIAFDPG
ncbi:MAG TPA: hypothetical protein VHX17_06640 [Candidatus Cybelea sp.]|jgi:hypothetical protein|nr:hypothetical protein [Candidatus Cybelea sp.]